MKGISVIIPGGFIVLSIVVHISAASDFDCRQFFVIFPGVNTIFLRRNNRSITKLFRRSSHVITLICAVHEERLLTITGSGTLDVLSDEYGAAIGSGLYNIEAYKACGNIDIQGGTIYARGGGSAASIGSGASINYVEPQTGPKSSCGNITIRNSVSHVYVKQNSGAERIGSGQYSTCGTVTLEDADKISTIMY